MIDVKRLKVLHEVARQGSFSAAADALSYTQSAVSQQIAALERETGTTLVERGARGIRMTDAGEALVRHADAILTRITDAEAELRSQIRTIGADAEAERAVLEARLLDLTRRLESAVNAAESSLEGAFRTE